MLKPVDIKEIVSQYLQTNPQAQTLKVKPKGPKQWKDTFELLGIGTPQVNHDPTKHKLKIFKLTFSYQDIHQKKVRSHTVTFGSQQDYIFHKNPELRIKRLKSLKSPNNPFHCDYWTAQLCNKFSTLAEGLAAFDGYFIEKKNDQLQKVLKKTQIK